MDDLRSLERELLTRYRREREKAARDRDDANARFATYDKAVTGLEGVLGELPEDDAQPTDTPTPQNGHSEPRGVEAVKLILEEIGSLAIGDLADEMVKRGAIAPDAQHPLAASRAAFNRLRRKEPSRYALQHGRAVRLADDPAQPRMPLSEEEP